MGIRFKCSHCKSRLNVKQSQSGQAGQCPTCAGEIFVPLESTIQPRRRKRKKKSRRQSLDAQSESGGIPGSISAHSDSRNGISDSRNGISDSRIGVQSVMQVNGQSGFVNSSNGTTGRSVSFESHVNPVTNSDDIADSGNSGLRVFEPVDPAVTAELTDTGSAEKNWGHAGTRVVESHSDVAVLPEESTPEKFGNSLSSSIVDDDKFDPMEEEVDSSQSFNLSKPKLELDGKHPIRDFPNKIWYVRGKRLGEKGPLTGVELEEMIEDRIQIKKGYIVWREDWIDWQPAELVFPELNQDPATRKALSDPNYRIPDELNPHSEISRRRRFKKTFGIAAIGLSLVTVVLLSYVLIRVLG